MKDFSNTLPELELANALYARVNSGSSFINSQGEQTGGGLFQHVETAFIFRDVASVSSPRIAGFMKERPLEEGEYYSLIKDEKSGKVTCGVSLRV